MTPVTSVRFSSLGTPWPAPPPGMHDLFIERNNLVLK